MPCDAHDGLAENARCPVCGYSWTVVRELRAPVDLFVGAADPYRGERRNAPHQAARIAKDCFKNEEAA